MLTHAVCRQVIRINIPALTSETRAQFAKQALGVAEDGKVDRESAHARERARERESESGCVCVCARAKERARGRDKERKRARERGIVLAR
jgi:hypothetical protein